MSMQDIVAGSSGPVRITENFSTLAAAALYGQDPRTTTGLTWGYIGGIYRGTTVADGTVALTDNATNYVVAARSTGVVSVSTSTTNWNDTATYDKVRKITTASGVVAAGASEDRRMDTGGLFTNNTAAATGITLTSKSADYTLVLGDANQGILHPSADTTARTATIPANASVAYTVGTVLFFANQHSAGNLSIAITSDTMRLAGAGTTGTRTLAADGVATALKVTPTEWLIFGTNLT